MADASYLRADGPVDGRRPAYERLEAAFGSPPRRRRGRARWLAVGLLGSALIALGAGAFLLARSSASLTADDVGLARVSLPPTGGSIADVSVHGSHDALIPARVENGRIIPTGLIPAHERISIQVTVKRPGWISWLAGSTQRVEREFITPAAALRAHYLTLRPGEPIRLRFSRPVQAVAYGPPGTLHRRVLRTPVTTLVLPRAAIAGTISVAAAPRPWETSRAAAVSWFPAGAAASVVAVPAPGSTITPRTPITLTFSKPVARALGSARPALTPATEGRWRTLNSHTIEFRPTGYGYGLAASVAVGLPAGVSLVGGSVRWHVPAGSTLRLHQILAQLGYLPLTWHPSGPPVPADVAGQESAAISPPAGSFSWRWSSAPAALRSLWSEGTQSVLTRGAVMSFQNEHGLSPDGSAGPAAWRALIAASITGRRSTFGYTFVTVSKTSQRLDLWHSGRTILTTAVNTGIASAPTAGGTYPVFEHIPVGTMSGSNPDGSHYNDPGIQYISYFNGGDALHAFNRAQYGSPQSLGCVEMATGPAGQVYPYTPIGTLVHVE